MRKNQAAVAMAKLRAKKLGHARCKEISVKAAAAWSRIAAERKTAEAAEADRATA